MIPRLEDLSIGYRIILSFVIVLIVLLVAAAVGYVNGRWEVIGEETPQLYQGIPFDAHLLPIDKRALESAYHDHLKLLFSVWLKDDVTATQRINNGLRIARRAYGHAIQQIERRERELQKK